MPPPTLLRGYIEQTCALTGTAHPLHLELAIPLEVTCNASLAPKHGWREQPWEQTGRWLGTINIWDKKKKGGRGKKNKNKIDGNTYKILHSIPVHTISFHQF